MANNTKPYAWDYKLVKDWQPTTDYEWRWFLERKINYDDFRNIDMKKVKQMIEQIKIDEGKRLLLKAYFKYYEK